jgi:exonuclease III
MASSINFLSLNIGMSSSLAGLTSLIPAHNLDIIFLQEVRLTSEQINNFLDRLGFQAEVNIDQDHPSSPGTAIAWKKSLPVTDVNPLVLCRVQVATLGSFMLLNIYAPSSSEKKHERNVGEHIFGSNLDLHHHIWSIIHSGQEKYFVWSQ